MKRLFLALALTLACTAAAAQNQTPAKTTPQDDSRLWKRIENLCDEQHYNTAYKLADSTRTKALAQAKALAEKKTTSDEVSRRLLVSTWYLGEMCDAYRENCDDSVPLLYQEIKPYLSRADMALCLLLLDEKEQAMADTAYLATVKVDESLPLILKPDNASFIITPTYYDLLMSLSADSYYSYSEKLPTYAAWIAHTRALQPSAQRDRLLLYLELQEAYALRRLPNKSLKEKLAPYQRLLNQFRGTQDDQLATAYHRIAELLNEEKQYVEALRYCDSAIAAYPRSEGAIGCKNLREEILKISIVTHVTNVSPADREILVTVDTRNVKHLYYRIYDTPYGGWKGDRQKQLLGQPVQEEWDQPLEVADDHQTYQHYGYAPMMPPGEYMLAVSPTPNFAESGFSLEPFTVSAAAFTMVRSKDRIEGYLVDYTTGQPIANHKVELGTKKNYSDKYKYTATNTGKDGFFTISYDLAAYSLELRTRYKGYTTHYSVTSSYFQATSKEQDSYQLMTDRPIYRPGDTVQALLLAGNIQRNREGATRSGLRLAIILTDPNNKAVDSADATTDAYGSLSCKLKLPEGCLPGRYTIAVMKPEGSKKAFTASKVIHVEAYKQPKFTVTLRSKDRKAADGSSLVPQFGDSLTVEGLAASYSQVPVDGAQVRYTIKRNRLMPWWRRWSYGRVNEEQATLRDDTLVTDQEGMFRIAFVPMPDSSVELSEKPCFLYTVTAYVTDLNGETHSQSTTLRVGYENSYIAIDLPEEARTLDGFDYQYCDLNGVPLTGSVTVTVEKLRQPEEPYLASRVYLSDDRKHYMTREEFHKHFPLTGYDKSELLEQYWPVEKTLYSTTVKADGSSSHHVPLPKLEAGAYKVTLRCGETENEAVVAYTPEKSKTAVTSDLIWADLDKGTALPGDKVTLRVGSRHKDLYVMYELLYADSLVDRRTLQLDNNIKSIEIPITEALLGGADIQLYAVKEGRSQQQTLRLEVPFEHKKLELELETFRDKLIPGEQETWTLKVKPIEEPAAVLLGMYDASLDSYYGGLSYSWWPWKSMQSQKPFSPNNFKTEYSNHLNMLKNGNSYDWYNGNKPKGYSLRRLHYYNMSNVLVMASYEEEEEMFFATDDARIVQKGARNQAKSSQAGLVYEEMAVVSDLAIVDDEVPEPKEEEKEESYLRSNLSTLAFFEPHLRTDADGTLRYSFTAPDLLTQWNINALAWTTDIRTGTLQRKLVTQKKLMVQPNMPRFLREGDTATLMAKVSNLTDSAMEVTVELAFDGKEQQQRLLVPARGSAKASFAVSAPAGGTVATYRFVARGDKHSDGEQGPLPILTSRQAVTQSVSMYINGVGSKDYSIELPASQTAEPLGFTVEYTANPIWLAIQTLPYMSDHQNPSNLYLFNSFYVNSLGLQIAQQYPELEHYADQASDTASNLFANADIKQTMLEETPWLRDGQQEAQRLKQIANFYDAKSLQRQLDDNMKKLKAAQRGDGSWSWMPDGHYPSLYTTQYILRGCAQLARESGYKTGKMERKALGYADQEAYKSYLEWQKLIKKYPNSHYEPINLDYLYTRSFYGKPTDKNALTAFNCFYGNLKKHHSEYTSLYSQAMLALIFHRYGDKQLAREMTTRIKEKALYSDEMGMYWRDNKAGWFYYERPIETQALIIETFREVLPGETASVGKMQQWLLKQKQTTSWNTDIATLRAIQALKGEQKATDKPTAARIAVSGGSLRDTLATPQEGAGYLRHTYRGDSLAALNDRSIKATIQQEHNSIAWGALYYQYTEEMSKVTASETGITLRYELLRVNTDGSTTPAKEVQLKVGDRLRIRLSVSCDRNLEYVEMKSFRAACLEPVSTKSGWRWNSGLRYYVAVNNSHDALYADRLDKGKYVIESDYYVTNPGSYTLAPAVLQCLYAPEFRATSEGGKIVVN